MSSKILKPNPDKFGAIRSNTTLFTKKNPLIGSVSLALEIVLAKKLASFDKAFLYLVKPNTFLCSETYLL